MGFHVVAVGFVSCPKLAREKNTEVIRAFAELRCLPPRPLSRRDALSSKHAEAAWGLRGGESAAITRDRRVNTVIKLESSSVTSPPHFSKQPAPPGIEARRERQRREARRAILDATQTLLSESEAGDFSIRGLTERCGYSAPTIYYHFGDKDGLLTALLDDGMQILARELHRCFQSEDALDRLRSILLTFIRYATEHPTFSALWGTVSRQPGNEMPRSYDEVKDLLDSPVRDLVDAGRLNDLDTTRAEQMLWAMLHGLIALQMAEPDHPWAPGLAEDTVDSLLRGMTTSSGGTTR